MLDEKLFDYNRYIQERLKEIDDLEERRYAKEILLEGLANIFSLSEKRYHDLERRIRQEIEVPWDCYEIFSAVTERKQYDPIHETLFPVCMEDVSSCKSQKVHTIYLVADDEIYKEFLRIGTIYGTAGERKIPYKISSCIRYAEAVERLHRMFLANQIPWSTVHTGHLERFFDLEPAEETEENTVIQWGKWEAYVRNDMLPLWNIREMELASSQFAVPCLDGIWYEHSFIMRDMKSGTFLVDTDSDITEVRNEQNSIVLKSRKETLKKITVYQICNETEHFEASEFPVLSNKKADSFTGRYLYKVGNFLQTGAELFRKVAELAGSFQVLMDRYEIKEKMDVPILQADMNYFIKEEVFPREQRKCLVFYFKKNGGEYLYQSHIRYLLSQLQLEYIEYKCVGVVE